MKDNIVYSKSYKFALNIISLYGYLVKNKKEYTLSKQLLRSGTSIGANIKEGVGGHSKKDFIFKLQIAYKEALESDYWLSLIRDSNILEPEMANKLIYDCQELIKILSKILSTSKNTSNY